MEEQGHFFFYLIYHTVYFSQSTMKTRSARVLVGRVLAVKTVGFLRSLLYLFASPQLNNWSQQRKRAAPRGRPCEEVSGLLMGRSCGCQDKCKLDFFSFICRLHRLSWDLITHTGTSSKKLPLPLPGASGFLWTLDWKAQHVVFSFDKIKKKKKKGWLHSQFMGLCKRRASWDPANASWSCM